MPKHTIMAFQLKPGHDDEALLEELEHQFGWMRCDVRNVMMKAYREHYEDNGIIGSAKVELEDCCADAKVKPKSVVITVCTQAPGMFTDDSNW